LLETRVYGSSPYADGVSKIVLAVAAHPLENRLYAIGEFIEHGWIQLYSMPNPLLYRTALTASCRFGSYGCI
jgi:hypothetical protein